ncbi:cytochrome C [Zobellia amurskyensis]|uniref:Cytochrome C n=1 Tax=Zobellia amurskyensis TaxID=248905 RepID=A0A7X2ZW47_9FLAO|nr:c-type cytochrome [Zobellia amurskyensis]MUH37508.1 cytochrome C [Zobellia amurskyensis]
MNQSFYQLPNRSTTQKSLFVTSALILLALGSCKKEKPVYADVIYTKPTLVKDPPVVFMSPEESMKTMHLPEGYHMELVASEPMINEPVTIAWGPDGKLYVAEMLTYMQDIDGTNENEPWSRVSVLEDTDGDGKMDKSTVFVDSLILPRIILPLDDRILIGETYNRSLYTYRDTDGDNVADEKKLVLENNKRDNANLEHQSATMIWGLDNYLYLSNGSLRYRFTRGEMEIDTLRDAPSGQWGMTQDEIGQLYYSSAGGETPALGYQQHPYYGTLEMEGKWEEGFEKVWPIIGTPDVQGGFGRLREDGTLNHFTASCGQSIFLGDKLSMYGDLFIPEPVGRLIRRAKVNLVNGKKVLSNPYGETEFLASTDTNFRPVDTQTGPDGCLYVVDMYRGIIQEGNWVRKGSFLRPVVERKGFDKNVGKGRIYRIVHEEIAPSKQEDLLHKTNNELLEYLHHPNGWYRLTAQKVLVLKQDKSTVSDLKDMVTGGTPFIGSMLGDTDYALGRLHAIWTLDGLDAIDKPLVLAALQDEDARVRAAALRVSEPFLKSGDASVFEAVQALKSDKDPEVLQQVVLSLNSAKDKMGKETISEIMAANPSNEAIATIGEESLKEVPLEIEKIKKQYVLQNSNTRKRIVEGYNNFKNLCAACHGMNGTGIEGMAPSLVGSPRVTAKDWNITVKILLNGLTGPVDGKEYSGVMAGMKQQDDDYIASVVTYIRMHLNNEKGVGGWQVSKVRKEQEGREDYWTIEELEKSK